MAAASRGAPYNPAYVVNDIKALVCCSHDVLDRVQELTLFQPNASAAYAKKFGARYVRFLELQVRVGLVRQACLKASQILTAETPFKYPKIATTLAASKFGVGACEQVGILAWIKTALKGDSCFISTSALPDSLDNCSTHGFLLVGVEKEKILRAFMRGMLVETLFKDLNEGTLIDPFLGDVSSVVSFNAKETLLGKYMAIWGTKYIFSLQGIEAINMEVLCKEIQAIYKEALQTLPFLRDNGPFNDLLTIQHREVGDRMVVLLKTRFPEPKWKAEIRGANVVVWAEVTKGQLEEIQKVLKEKGIEDSKERPLDIEGWLRSSSLEKMENPLTTAQCLEKALGVGIQIESSKNSENYFISFQNPNPEIYLYTQTT